jgi:hypothetical protein
MSIAGRISEHPVLSYMTFVLPMLLLLLGIVFKANVFLIILTLAWLGVAFLVLYLPMAEDNNA